MRISETLHRVHIDGRNIPLRRTTGGVVEMWGQGDLDFAAGLGFAHAYDRTVQMMLLRLVGQGRVSECLDATDEALELDVFARDMGFAREAARDVATLSERARRFAGAYCEGVNACLRVHGTPFELRLVRYRPEPWRPEDVLLTIKLMSYVGLGQTQQDMEKLLVQAIAGGVPFDLLARIFRPHLDGCDEALRDAISEVRVERGLLPEAVRFSPVLPSLEASNNWAVAPNRSATGGALQCNDPHLEVNRLPAIWYEVIAHTEEDYRMGITMPGVPGLVMGRTRHLSMGFTYGFMDMVDYFIEDVRDGRWRRGDGFEDFDVRTETIRRKGREPVHITVRENVHGVLEADPHRPELPDGKYLCRAWSGHRRGAADSLNAVCDVLGARRVEEAQAALRRVSISANWVLADSEGNIGYQQSGRLPRRQHSGLHPVPGWDPRWDWQGMVDPTELSATLNPECGFVATANNDLDLPGRARAINLPMGSYRADRIAALLGGDGRLGVEDMKRIQLDLYSLHAERHMAVLRPLLPDTPAARLLADWDLRYSRDSRGASLFEDVYHALLEAVFGERVFGRDAWRTLVDETAVVHDYYHLFDDVLFGDDDPRFFGDAGRDALFRAVAARVLDGLAPEQVPPWGRRRTITMSNVFFGGRLPRFLGFDHGPVQLEGNRSTVVQCALFRAHGRLTSFHPSWRYVTDLSDDAVHTALAGGPSERRFSRHYTTDVDRWLGGGYKELRPREEV